MDEKHFGATSCARPESGSISERLEIALEVTSAFTAKFILHVKTVDHVFA